MDAMNQSCGHCGAQRFKLVDGALFARFVVWGLCLTGAVLMLIVDASAPGGGPTGRGLLITSSLLAAPFLLTLAFRPTTRVCARCGRRRDMKAGRTESHAEVTRRQESRDNIKGWILFLVVVLVGGGLLLRGCANIDTSGCETYDGVEICPSDVSEFSRYN